MAAQNITSGTQIGPSNSPTDGTFNWERGGRNGELIVASAHGPYVEAATRGNTFTASNAVAGVAPGTALSTSPAFQLYNPTGSGYGLAIQKVGCGYLSGTLGAGMIVLSYYNAQAAAPTGGTALTPVCNNMTARTAKQGKAFTGSTIGGTSVIVRPLFNIDAIAGSGDTPPAQCDIDLKGEFVVLPGSVVCLQGVTAAGTSPKVIFSMSWEEIPLGALELSLTT